MLRTPQRASVLVLSVCLLALMSSGTAGAQQRERRGMRFAGMDTNNDGVIARSEWRGSEASFKVHDWDDDGVLSGDEVRPGGRRRTRTVEPEDFETLEREYPFTDWSPEGFDRLDHNKDGRIGREEWHFDRDSFTRADHNRDGALERGEFLGEDAQEDDDREDSFGNLDDNRDGRVSRGEWHGSASRFAALDADRNGVLTRAELAGTAEPPPDLFTSVDVNRDGSLTWDEWHWSRGSFDERDTNRDGRVSREEVGRAGGPTAAQTQAHRAGYERGLADGRTAGRGDRTSGLGWALEGQRELESADAGYDAQLNARAEYQAGYRDGFRRGYREGYAAR